jgi:hypothetical protein
LIARRSRKPARARTPRARLALVLVVLIAQSATPAAAIEYTSGPVYGGTVTWTTPVVAPVPLPGNGFLAVTSFEGRFVAVERNGVASTSSDGRSWVGHALPGSFVGVEETAQIAAGTNRVAIIGTGAAWTTVDGDTWIAATAPPVGPAKPTAITALGDGFAAVGTAPGQRRAAAWVSADGVTWTASPDQPAFDHFCPTAVVGKSAGRIVAVGDDCYPYLARPTAAFSDDGGLTWSRAPAQSSFSEEGRLTAVVAGGPGFIGVGSGIRDVYPRASGAAIFVSADGSAWRRVGYFAPPASSSSGHVFLRPVPGGYLAFATGGEKADTFVSAEGLHWTQSASVPINYEDANAIQGFAVNGTALIGVGTTYRHVDYIPHTFIVVGALSSAPAVTGQIPVPPTIPTPALPSVPRQPVFPGTVTWAVAPFPVDAPAGALVLGSEMHDVSRWMGGFAALGSETFDGEVPRRDVVWTSLNGTRWTEHVLPVKCGNMRWIAASQSAIVVASEAGICRSSDGTKWTRALDVPHQIKGFVDLTAGGPGFLLLMSYPTSPSVSAKVWRSVDGLHWRTAGHPAAFSNLDPTVIADGPRGIVVLGQQYTRGRGYDSIFRPLRSRDAVTWSRGLRQNAFEPQSFAEGRAAMIRGGPGYLATGSYQPRSRIGAAVWTSPDGLAWKRAYLMMPASGYVEVGGLARIGPGYALVGVVAPPSQEDPARPTVWLSPDGVRWRSGVSLPLPVDGAGDWADMATVAGGSVRIVAVGNRHASGGLSTAHFWTGIHHAP